jgi:hypothetical protein
MITKVYKMTFKTFSLEFAEEVMNNQSFLWNYLQIVF